MSSVIGLKKGGRVTVSHLSHLVTDCDRVAKSSLRVDLIRNGQSWLAESLKDVF